jgi:hypothetical protein
MDSIKAINFNPIYIHPEEEPIIDDINKNITEIDTDLKYIDNTLTSLASSYNSLMESTKMKLNNIKDLINLEKERQEDINILCSKYSDFSSVMNLSASDFEGDLTIDNGVLTAAIYATNSVYFTADDVSGNGMAGNDYVYQNDAFLSDTLSTSNPSTMCDDSLTTYYEYQRITVNNTDEAPLAFNRDSNEAECSIILSSGDYFNKVLINSDRDDLVLKEVYISKDGANYTLDKEYNIQINKIQEKYKDSSYIYGSGIISVSLTKYVKLCFKSNGYTEDTLAFIKTFNDNSSITKKITKVLSAKRHAIRINGISLSKNTYVTSMSVTKELITDPVKYISLYCNEYAGSDDDVSDMIKYYLIINGIEHEVIPINCQRNGKKIIRTSSQTYKLDNTDYIEESIKSAKLKIVINTSTSKTPFISNMKILIGGYN